MEVSSVDALFVRKCSTCTEHWPVHGSVDIVVRMTSMRFVRSVVLALLMLLRIFTVLVVQHLLSVL